MRQTLAFPVMIVLTLAILTGGAWASSGRGPAQDARSRFPLESRTLASGTRDAQLETLWIFFADYEDELGDNAGWTVHDLSGTTAMANAWHHDTIRIPPHLVGQLGESTWWCGTVNPCWVQPRGYGNNWRMVLERSFPEIEANTSVGDQLTLDFDQRFAMEHDYDYGYVDVSTDGGSSWSTHHTVSNPGFAGQPGSSKDWDDVQGHGHVTLDMSLYAGQTIDLRFRFESDDEYSSQDQPDSPPQSPCLDGAWQLDNITWTGGSPAVGFWTDDCESGDAGWAHDDSPASGQIGQGFWRGQYVYAFENGRDFTCGDRAEGTWMYAAVDPFTSEFIDDGYTALLSPPIDISAAPKLIGQWDFWVDAAIPTGDVFNLYLASSDVEECVTDLDGFIDEEFGWYWADPGWYTRADDWDAFAGNDWLAILWAVRNQEGDWSGQHGAAMLMNWQRVGVPSGDPGTVWERSLWENFNDWFIADLEEALGDTTRILVKDDDGVASVYVLASDDDGSTWSSYACEREEPDNPSSSWWLAPPPAGEMTRGSEIRYYFESTDGVGNTSTLPPDAPDGTYEMSILPIEATTGSPGILLVDKHGHATPGATRVSGQELTSLDPKVGSETYYREALDILGFEYEVYDVEVPSGSIRSDGPDTAGMKYYHTQIWFTNQFAAFTLNRVDQFHLIQWLGESDDGKERNLLLTGNEIGYELMETGRETMAFYETWLASEYLENTVGAVTIDSVPGIEEHAGGFDFMTNDDGECILQGGCPITNHFDVVRRKSGVVGAETVADYVRQDGVRKTAGAAYTHASMGYQTVNLGFGIEFMMDGTVDGGAANYTAEGHHRNGIEDRIDFLGNIMEYFGVAPQGLATEVAEGTRPNILSQAYPNPFNPATTIAYAVREPGRVSIRIANVAGKLVRTLVDEELPAGASGPVTWDGTNDAGETCASGVYFYRIEAPGFAATRKMILLK